MIFKEENPLKRAYEFFANPKAQFNKLTQPHWENTAIVAQSLEVVLAVGDTTYFDYGGDFPLAIVKSTLFAA